MTEVMITIQVCLEFRLFKKESYNLNHITPDCVHSRLFIWITSPHPGSADSARLYT